MDEDEKSACILEGWAAALRQVCSLKKELADAQEQVRRVIFLHNSLLLLTGALLN